MVDIQLGILKYASNYIKISKKKLFFSAGCIFLISAGTVAISLVETRRQSQALHDMVAASNTLVRN
jgi:hypothetical protein